MTGVFDSVGDLRHLKKPSKLAGNQWQASSLDTGSPEFAKPADANANWNIQ
jgi:hypothetical protein